MIEKISSKPMSEELSVLSHLKPKQIKFTEHIDFGLGFLRDLFSSGDDPVVSILKCDACNQGCCIDCLRGRVALGIRSDIDSIDFDKNAYKIINNSDIPIRITYENVYVEDISKSRHETKLVERQVYIEMDYRLKPFTKNVLKEDKRLKSGAMKFKILS